MPTKSSVRYRLAKNGKVQDARSTDARETNPLSGRARVQRAKAGPRHESTRVAAMNTLRVDIEGTAPLKLNKRSEESIQAQLYEQTTGQKAERKPREVVTEALSGCHFIGDRPRDEAGLSKSHFGIPAIAFRLAMVQVANMAGGHKTAARLAFFVDGDAGRYVRVHALAKPSISIDPVRLNGKTASLAFRVTIPTWKASLTIRHFTSAISEAKVLELLHFAAGSVGVGSHRITASSCGECGSFRVVRALRIVGGKEQSVEAPA